MSRGKLHTNLISVLLAMLTVSALAITASAAAGDNIALSASVVDCSGYANDEELPEFAIDGNIDTKWCSHTQSPTEDASILAYGEGLGWITFDLGEEKYFNKYEVYHASLCERDFGRTYYNASEWAVLVSNDLTEWNEISVYSGNTEEVTVVDTELCRARYVRFVIIRAEQADSDGNVIRIPEIKIIESDEGGTVTEGGAEDILAAMEQAKAEEDLAFRKSLIAPAIIYCAIASAAAVGVAAMVKLANRKK